MCVEDTQRLASAFSSAAFLLPTPSHTTPPQWIIGPQLNSAKSSYRLLTPATLQCSPVHCWKASTPVH